MTKIGLLLPHSTLYPSLSFDIAEGLKAGLASAGLKHISWTIEGIGFGTDADELLTKAQKLLLQEEVDVVIGMMHRRMAEGLAPLFNSANRLLLLLDVAGDFFVGAEPAPTVFYHSLQASLGCRLTGRKAVEAGARGVIQASSFYDAGYLQGYAFSQGITTNGGQVLQYFVSSHIPEQVNVQQLQDGITKDDAQAVTALYAGDLAEQFYQLYPALPRQLPLWVSPMMLEEQMLSRVSFGLEGIRGHVAWSEQLESNENDNYKEAIRSRGRQPNIFSVLGFEGGMIAACHLMGFKDKDQPSSEDFKQLESMSFRGPRGLVQFNPDTHYSFGQQYAATVVPDAQGRCRLAALVPEPAVDRDFNAFRSEAPPLTHTGWHNSYLCI